MRFPGGWVEYVPAKVERGFRQGARFDLCIRLRGHVLLTVKWHGWIPMIGIDVGKRRAIEVSLYQSRMSK